MFLSIYGLVGLFLTFCAGVLYSVHGFQMFNICVCLLRPPRLHLQAQSGPEAVIGITCLRYTYPLLQTTTGANCVERLSETYWPLLRLLQFQSGPPSIQPIPGVSPRLLVRMPNEPPAFSSGTQLLLFRVLRRRHWTEVTFRRVSCPCGLVREFTVVPLREFIPFYIRNIATTILEAKQCTGDL